MSRSEKILAARSAFGQDGQGHSARGALRTVPSAEKKEIPGKEIPKKDGHYFGIIRMLAAGMAFLALIVAFHFQVSYQGFDRESVEKVLSDDSHWNLLVDEVSETMRYLQKGEQ